jgi:hypothetical protein
MIRGSAPRIPAGQRRPGRIARYVAARNLRETWLLTAQMAPYLLLGFAAAGALSGADARPGAAGGGGCGWFARSRRCSSAYPCPCALAVWSPSPRPPETGRVPAPRRILTTPQTGVDSIPATHALMGPWFAVPGARRLRRRDGCCTLSISWAAVERPARNRPAARAHPAIAAATGHPDSAGTPRRGRESRRFALCGPRGSAFIADIGAHLAPACSSAA